MTMVVAGIFVLRRRIQEDEVEMQSHARDRRQHFERW